MDDLTIKELHKRLCLIMNEIHKLCIDNGIHYTLIGGSLIGAVRHKGFIPWDDDIDIAMTYDNYLKFINVAFDMKHDWIEFCMAGKSKDYYHPFVKAYDSRTTFIEGHGDKPMGIFVDIFPVVPCGNTIRQAKWVRKKYRFWQSLLKRKGYLFQTGQIREKILCLLSSLFSVSYLVERINHHLNHLSHKAYMYSTDLDGTERGIVPSRLFIEYIMYKFDSYYFMGIKNADEYLRLVFGEYLVLPPDNQRNPHHIFYINLNKSYKDYE